MAIPGVDYTMVAVPRAKTVARFHDELPQCACNADWGLPYQKCRFCERGWPELKHLNKYAVRHYVCDDCRRHFMQGQRGR